MAHAWLFEKGKCRGRRNYIQQNFRREIPSDIVYQDDLVTAFRIFRRKRQRIF